MFLHITVLAVISINLVVGDAIVTNANEHDGVVLVEKRPFTLQCLSSEGIRTWRKSEPYRDQFRDIRPDDRIVFGGTNQNISEIEIKEASKSDVGDYLCATLDDRQTALIKVRLKPKLNRFEEYAKFNYKSANLVEGEKFTLNCELSDGEDDRDILLHWIKSDDKALMDNKVNFSEISDPHFKVVMNDNKTSLSLTIDNVNRSDRAYYTCMATNDIMNHSQVIFLRVKDKLGALWPFLGIVGEVVILCTIIFIYEKRRIKPDFDDSDNADNTETKSGQQDRSGKSPEIRQRK